MRIPDLVAGTVVSVMKGLLGTISPHSPRGSSPLTGEAGRGCREPRYSGETSPTLDPSPQGGGRRLGNPGPEVYPAWRTAMAGSRMVASRMISSCDAPPG